MRTALSLSLAVVALMLSACSVVSTTKAAAEVCADAAAANTTYTGTIVGAFDTNVGTILRLVAAREMAVAGAFQDGPPRVPPGWSDMDPSRSAVLCYIDNDSPIPRPYESLTPEPRGWDRVAVAVVGREAEVVMAGFREELLVAASIPPK